MTAPGGAVVLGARNLGGEIARELLGHGAAVASIARTQADLDLLAAAGALTLRADAADRGGLDEALRRAAGIIGPPDLIVNATAPARPPKDGSGFGGGAMLAASQAGFDAWVLAVAQQTFVFLGAGAEALAGRGGTLVQITGAPARRATPERGLVSAGGAAVRAMTHAAAQELAGQGIHVALLVVDGPIASPKTAAMTRTMAPQAIVEQAGVAAAVLALARQPPSAWTHELVVTPSGGRWIP
jgi:NAD(P)-dependent dehydrogenase (short-subunit alcohol dehydrogenase family)